VNGDATASVTAALFGLDGFRILAAADAGGELELLVETTAELVGCPGCGAVARAKDRRPTWVRDLPIGGRPVVVCWNKRIWCCVHAACPVKTWTEGHPAIAPRACLTERARAWAFEQVGQCDAAVSRVAAELGVAWWTIMSLTVARGTPIIEEPDRLGEDVEAVGVDETAFLRATGKHPTWFATGITDLTPGRAARLLDIAEGRSGSVLADWLAAREPQWRTRIITASLDPFRGYATALATQLPHATRVLDPFHVVKLGLSCLDEVRRRVQQDTTGHRGRTGDPLYGIRRVLRRRRDRLSTKARARLEAGLIAGDPTGETTLAWTVAQDLISLYQLTDPEHARPRATKLITTLRSCPIPEIAKLGRTLHMWRTELLAHFDPPTSPMGPLKTSTSKLRTPSGSPAATAISNTTGYDSCSTTAASTKITHRHGSEPAVPGSLRRAV
jgi:transposase